MTFNQSGGGFSVAESIVPAFESGCCVYKWLEKAILRRVIASLGKQKGRHNIGSYFIDKAVA